MTVTTFFIPAINMMGSGAVEEAINSLKPYGYKRAVIVTDAGMNKMGVADKVKDIMTAVGIETTIFDGAQPNPTVANVEDGLKVVKEIDAELIVSLGGGSSHDCAKGIALVATNGGSIKDYEGIDQSPKAQLPLVSINTTAGTASEMTRFCIITDESRHVKMAIVDRHTTPILSVNDPAYMLGMPKGLTAATGMDALTHAVEAYVSTAATPITDACALKAVTLISENLRTAVNEGSNMEARTNMAYAQFLAGMAFNNASLGYVHAMAHQLGGFYNLPHGVCNAVLLPHVEEFNSTTSAARLKDVAASMGVDVAGMSDEDGAKAAIEAIKTLSRDIGIPAGLTELGMKDEDVRILSENALKDACGLTNPRPASLEEIEAIFRAAA